MLTSKFLKGIKTEARPIIERMLDDADLIAGLRDVFTAQGGDWGALKALIKAEVQDDRDETGDGKRVRKILDKAGSSTAYADMLGMANMNENNFIADDEDYDPDTGEITQTQPAPLAALDLTADPAPSVDSRQVTHSEQPSVEAHDAEGADHVSNAVAHAPTQNDSSANAGGENVAASLEIDTPRENDIETTSAGKTAGASASAAPLTFIPRKQLRPLCQNRERCGASSPKECYLCLKAAAQVGAA